MSPALMIRQTTNDTTERTLSWLLEGIADAPPIPLTDISSDSRNLMRGGAFLAFQGATHHGLQFVDQAIAAGVAAIVVDGASPIRPVVGDGIAVVTVPRLQERLGDIANRWFEAPSRRMKVCGVTGTNGKTTVSFLIARCLQMLGSGCGYMGTLGAGIAELDAETGLTTPGCIDLHRQLARFAAADAGFASLEVSSHALDQNRVDGVCFDSVLFSNLSRDHIDYHGNMHAYGETKARFLLAAGPAHRIVLTDSAFGRILAERCGAGVVAVSTRRGQAAMSEPFLQMLSTSADEYGSAVEVRSSWGAGSMRLPLAGDFNVANAALVLTQLLCWNVPFADALEVLGRIAPPPGRMQRVAVAAVPRPVVYVDYAHTPAGLEAVLSTLRHHCRGELWCVFGCGGDRDRGKRATMGETVARLADRPVVTSDNPRGEPPGTIIAEVLGGMPADTVAIEDRASAIAYAIGNARDEDVILIAGKGHEEFQHTGATRRPFSDYAVAAQNLSERPGARGERP